MKYLIALVTAFMVCASTAAHSQSAVETRTQIASRQSALGHRLVRTACFAHAGIDPTMNMQLLNDTKKEIQEGIRAMIEGGGPFKLSPETDSTAITLLNTLQMVWAPLDTQINAFAETGKISTSELNKLSVKASSLEKMWANIISRLEQKSAAAKAPEKLDLARLSSASASQGKYLQQAGKLSCLLHFNEDPKVRDDLRRDLILAVSTFDDTVFALTFSNAKLKLIAPPTDPIQFSNFQLWQDWVGLESAFTAMATTDPNKAALRDLSHDIEVLHSNLDTSSTLYRDLIIAQAFASFGFDLGN